jgi:probable rRNA maturation factor
MINLDIKNPYKKQLSSSQIEEIVHKSIILAGNDANADISIVVDSDVVLHKLNKNYLGNDKPTDVLSFESNELNPETGNLFLGDIAVSFESAERQAAEAGHPLENEIALLLVHGILHLSGYNHETKTEKEQMWKKQQTILDSLNININRISGDEEFHD